MQQIYRELPILEVLEMLNEKVFCEGKFLYRQMQCMRVAVNSAMCSEKDRGKLNAADRQQKPRHLWNLQPDNIEDFKKDLKIIDEIIGDKAKNESLTEPCHEQEPPYE